MKKTGAHIFIESLKAEGVETIFCYPGGATLNITDALTYSDLQQIVVRHEQAAVHASDGYARASGKVGVSIVTSGPGATNTVTGIATAYMDSIPLIIFSCQVNTTLIGNDAFQEADITGITRPITKYNCIVKDVGELARTIKEAFYIASTGRPGPVLVDVPVDVEIAKYQTNGAEEMKLPGYKIRTEGHLRQISMAAQAINNSKISPTLPIKAHSLISLSPRGRGAG